jgi:hypothetical protein
VPARLRGWWRAGAGCSCGSGHRLEDPDRVGDPAGAIGRKPAAGHQGEGLDPTSASNALICIDNAGGNAAGLGGATERVAARPGLEIAPLTNVTFLIILTYRHDQEIQINLMKGIW